MLSVTKYEAIAFYLVGDHLAHLAVLFLLVFGFRTWLLLTSGDGKD